MMQELIYLSPILIISVWSVLTIVVDALTGKERNITYGFNILGFLLALVASIYTLTISPAQISAINYSEYLSNGQLTVGGFAGIFDIVFCVAALLTMFAARPYLKRDYDEYKEFYSLLIFSVAGMMIIGHSANLLSLFIGIEIMSVSFYVLAGFIRTRMLNVEASLKYFLLGAFATGFLVYGMAMLYGASGTMDLALIKESILNGSANQLYLQIGIVLMIVGLSFKVAAFPFHQWAPDVYTGSPTVVTAFMSTAGKAAALVAFMLIARAVFPMELSLELSSTAKSSLMAIAFISAATMLVGNITALVQSNVKRMLAYSSVAHAGYMLMGIVANTEYGYSGIIFYSAAYMFMQIGAFVVVAILERDGDQYMEFKNYSGLSKTHPWLAAAMAIFMFSLAGLPPFAGFPGKYMLFVAAIDAGFTWLTIVAVVSSIISMYFYIGLVLHIYFKEPAESTVLESKVGLSRITLVVSVIFIFALGILPGFLIDLAGRLF